VFHFTIFLLICIILAGNTIFFERWYCIFFSFIVYIKCGNHREKCTSLIKPNWEYKIIHFVTYQQMGERWYRKIQLQRRLFQLSYLRTQSNAYWFQTKTLEKKWGKIDEKRHSSLFTTQISNKEMFVFWRVIIIANDNHIYYNKRESCQLMAKRLRWHTSAICTFMEYVSIKILHVF